MGIYNLLVEAIKEDYSKMLFRRYENDEKDSNVSKEAELFFDISSNTSEINKANRITEYIIKEINSDRRWRVIVGPAMLLFSVKMENYRRDLLKKETIKGIFTIKSGFFETSLIPLAVIMLGKTKEKIWLSSVTTSDDIVSLVSDPENYMRKVYFTDLLDAKNFMPEYYNGELQKLNNELDKYETKKLGEIAEVTIGKSVPRHEWCDSGIPYLRGRDLQNGEITKSDVFISEKEVEKYAKQLLQEGDILLSKNFGQHKIAKVRIDDLPAIASNGLFIIRAYGVPEGYLYEYLTSETGKAIFDKQLSNIENRSSVASINLKDLVELKVPIFDEGTMEYLSAVEIVNIEDLLRRLSQIRRLNAYADLILKKDENQESQIENAIIRDFSYAGWPSEEVTISRKEDIIKLSNNIKWRPDLVLLDGKMRLAVVEVKTNFMQFTKDKLNTLNLVIQSGNIPFLILTTGNYYEIHSANNKVISKMTKPPTKEYLLSLLDGKEVN